MKKIQTNDFDLKSNVIKNLKQLLKKLLIKNMDIFYVKKLNQNIVNIIKKIFSGKIIVMNYVQEKGMKNIEV